MINNKAPCSSPICKSTLGIELYGSKGIRKLKKNLADRFNPREISRIKLIQRVIKGSGQNV